MMLITAPLEYEGLQFDYHILSTELKEFHQDYPFATGLDWSQQEFWAKMPDELALMFCLKYPQYTHLFRKI